MGATAWPDRLRPAAQRRRGLRSRQAGRDKLAVGDEIAELETIKANVSLFSPVGGTVVEVNPDLNSRPRSSTRTLTARAGWRCLKRSDWESDTAKLLDPHAYLFADAGASRTGVAG